MTQLFSLYIISGNCNVHNTKITIYFYKRDSKKAYLISIYYFYVNFKEFCLVCGGTFCDLWHIDNIILPFFYYIRKIFEIT